MNEGGRFPFLVFLAANVKAWTFGSASGVLKPKIELGTSGSKLKEHGVLPWWWRSWSPLRGRVQPAGAMAYSGMQISPGIKPVSPVSPALLVILYPLNHWGSKVCTWINLGKLCLIFFWLTPTVPWLWGITPDMIFLLRGNMFPDTMETTSFSLQIKAGLWPALCVKQVVGFLFHHYDLGIRIQYRIYLLSKFLTAQHSVIKTKKHYAVEMTPS